MAVDYKEIKNQAQKAILEYLDQAKLKAGDIFVVGASSSEIRGEQIGKGSDINCAEAVFEAIFPVLKGRGIFLAVQGCEHINRAIFIERDAISKEQEIVNVVPKIHAGGSFAVTFYQNAKNPVALEHIKADGGWDIGDTLIGMHLKDVAVPVRIETKKIGEANLVCARCRPKFIGGWRADYDEKLTGHEIVRKAK